MKKLIFAGVSLILMASLFLSGCSGQEDTSSEDSTADKEPVTLLIAAAASLEYSFEEQLIPMFQEEYPWITVEGTYDSSGKLQTQIEQGLEADIFMAAAMKQMNALTESNLIAADSVVELLENKIVLIVPQGSDELTTFEDITKAGTIAVGDPDSVPAGQYAKEALTTLGLWDQVSAKASFGSNVTEVLNWVSEGSADAGIVYETDAATTDKVTIVAEAPEDSLAEKILYPVGMVAASAHAEEAQLLIDFLSSDEALAVFESYGFTPNK